MDNGKSQSLITIEERRDILLNEIGTLIVASDEELKIASDCLTRLRGFLREAEKMRKDEVTPLNNRVSLINKMYQDVVAKAKSAELHINTQITSYYRKVEEEKRKEQERLDRLANQKFQRQIDKGQIPEVPEAVGNLVEAAPKTISTDGGKLSMKKVWKWRYATGADANPETTRIPNKYHLINEVMLNGIARSTKGTVDIPGVVFYEDYETSTRSAL